MTGCKGESSPHSKCLPGLLWTAGPFLGPQVCPRSAPAHQHPTAQVAGLTAQMPGRNWQAGPQPPPCSRQGKGQKVGCAPWLVSFSQFPAANHLKCAMLMHPAPSTHHCRVVEYRGCFLLLIPLLPGLLRSAVHLCPHQMFQWSTVAMLLRSCIVPFDLGPKAWLWCAVPVTCLAA